MAEKMAEKKATVPKIDEMAQSVLKAIGVDPGSENAARIYAAFKRYKDTVQPGRLSAEGYAFVATLCDLVEGKLIPPAKE